MADDQAQSLPNGSSYLLNADGQAILEAAPNLESGLSLLQQSYASKAWDKPDDAANVAADYAQQLRYRFRDDSIYRGPEADVKAPILMSEIPLDKTAPKAEESNPDIVSGEFGDYSPKEDSDEAVNLKQINDWEKNNLSVIKTSNDPTIVLQRQKLSDSITQRASELRQDITGKKSGFFTDAAFRNLEGATGGIAKLAGTTNYINFLKEQTNPKYDSNFASQVIGGAGFLEGATTSFLLGGPPGEGIFLGTNVAGQVKSTVQGAYHASGDTGQATAAGAIEAASQGVMLLGGKLIAKPLAKALGSIGDATAETVTKGTDFGPVGQIAAGGLEAGAAIATGSAGSQVAQNVGAGRPAFQHAFDTAGDNFLLGMVFGSTAGALTAGAKAIGEADTSSEYNPYDLDIGQPQPLVERVNLSAPQNAKGETENIEQEGAVPDFKDAAGNAYTVNYDGATAITDKGGFVRHPLDQTFFVSPEVAANLKIVENAARIRGSKFVITTDGDNLLVKNTESRTNPIQDDEVGQALIGLSNASKLRSKSGSDFVDNLRNQTNTEAVTSTPEAQSSEAPLLSALNNAGKLQARLPTNPTGEYAVTSQRMENIRDLNNSNFIPVDSSNDIALGKVPVQVASPRTNNGVDVQHQWHIGESITEINPDAIILPDQKLAGESTVGAAAAPAEEGIGYSKFSKRMRDSQNIPDYLKEVLGPEENPNKAYSYLKVSDSDASTETKQFIKERGGTNAINEALSWHDNSGDKIKGQILADLASQTKRSAEDALAKGDTKSAAQLRKTFEALTAKYATSKSYIAQALQGTKASNELLDPAIHSEIAKQRILDNLADQVAQEHGTNKETVQGAADRIEQNKEELTQLENIEKPIKDKIDKVDEQIQKGKDALEELNQPEKEGQIASPEAKKTKAAKKEKIESDIEKNIKIKQDLEDTEPLTPKQKTRKNQLKTNIEKDVKLSKALEDLIAEKSPELDAKADELTKLLRVAKTLKGKPQQDVYNKAFELQDTMQGDLPTSASGYWNSLWKANVLSNPAGAATKKVIGDVFALTNSAISLLAKDLVTGKGFTPVREALGGFGNIIKELSGPIIREEILKGESTYLPNPNEGDALREPGLNATTRKATGYNRTIEPETPAWVKSIAKGLDSVTSEIGKVSPQLEAGLRGVGRVIKPINAKLIFRLFQAPFKLSTRGDNEFFARYLEARGGQELGLKGDALREYVSQRLDQGPANMEEAFKQAQKEAEVLKSVGINYSPDQIKIRAMDIIDENRPIDTTQKARLLSNKMSYTKPPEGLVGSVFAHVGKSLADVPFPWKGGSIYPLKYFSVFYNVLGNVADANAEFLPGAAQLNYLFTEKNPFKLPTGDLSVEDITKQTKIARMALGTVATGLLFGLAKEGVLALHGSGPPDYQQRQQLLETGWKPDSFQIGNSFIEFSEANPLSWIAATLGNYFDKERYDKQFDGGSLSEFLGMYTGGILSSVNSLGFIHTFGDMLSAAVDPKLPDAVKLNKVYAFLTQPIQGFIPFSGALKQIAKDFDNPIETYNTIWGKLISGIPAVQHVGTEPRLNIFGEPLTASWTDKAGTAVGSLYSMRSSDPDFRWLGDNNYTIPDVYGLTLHPDSTKAPTTDYIQSNRIKVLGATYANVLTPSERTEYEKELGPRVRQIVENLRNTYTTSGRQDSVQKQLDSEINSASKQILRQIALRSIQ